MMMTCIASLFLNSGEELCCCVESGPGEAEEGLLLLLLLARSKAERTRQSNVGWISQIGDAKHGRRGECDSVWT